MTDSTSALKKEIARQGGDISKAARGLGYNYFAASKRFTQTAPDREPELGRAELRKYIIAHTRADRGWSIFQQTILEDARKKYDAGTHEMCQGRDGRIIIQYLIPRLIPTKPRRYFSQRDATV